MTRKRARERGREKVIECFSDAEASVLQFRGWKMTRRKRERLFDTALDSSYRLVYVRRMKAPCRHRNSASELCEGREAARKINLYPRGGWPPLTDSRIVRRSLSRLAWIVKNDDGARVFRPWQFSLHYGEHQSCRAFAGDECLTPHRASFSSFSGVNTSSPGDLTRRRGHSRSRILVPTQSRAGFRIASDLLSTISAGLEGFHTVRRCNGTT